MSEPGEATRLLASAADGDIRAADALMPLVYEDLRRLAAWKLRHEAPGHTLQATAIVNEVYLRLVDQRSARIEDRAHFFALAAQAVRRILIDHARGKKAAKRGGGVAGRTLEDQVATLTNRPDELVALDDALRALAELDPRQSRIVELKFFAGMTNQQVATVLDVSIRTVEADWSMAKSWLGLRMGDD